MLKSLLESLYRSHPPSNFTYFLYCTTSLRQKFLTFLHVGVSTNFNKLLEGEGIAKVYKDPFQFEQASIRLFSEIS